MISTDAYATLRSLRWRTRQQESSNGSCHERDTRSRYVGQAHGPSTNVDGP